MAAAASSLLALKRLLISPKSVRLLPLAVLSPSRLFSTEPEFVVDAFAPRAHDYDDFHLAVIRRLPYPSFAHVTDEGLNIREDMPGLGKEDLEVLVEPNKLIIKGERKMEQELGGVVYKYSASYYISEEKFNLNQVKAEIKKGELNVVVPKVTKDHKGD